ncbi:MAG: hypothetical protein RL410_1602 [Actinomycetota bacterium]|jgi:hypothetical protein
MSRIISIARQLKSDVGAISAEYATVAVAACGAGGILFKFLTSSSFASLLADILGKAFSWIFNLG